LQENGLIPTGVDYDSDVIYTLDISKLPIINRSMVKSISANELGELEFELIKLQADNKVYNYFEKLKFPKVSKDFVAKYSQEAEAWLKELGVTEFNGFNPKTESEESTDFYMSVNLATKIAGFSSLPKVEDVEKKIISYNEDGGVIIDHRVSLKASESLLRPAIADYYNQITSSMYITQPDDIKQTILENWLKTVRLNATKKKRSAMQKIAQIKFGLILSRGWFKEFSSFDENEILLNVKSVTDPLKIKFELTEKEEKI